MVGIRSILLVTGLSGFGSIEAEQIDDVALDRDISFVTTNGTWQDGRGYGYYRLVVEKIGWEHTRSLIYLQWLQLDQDKQAMMISRADVSVVMGEEGPEVEAGGGTSLHDVSGWFPCKEFWIPEGTEYSEEIHIRKDDKLKTSPSNPNLKGYHYQLEPRTQMAVVAFKGALDNMARAAVVRQCELAKG